MIAKFQNHKIRGRFYALFLFLLLLKSPAIAQPDREIARLGRGTANALDWRPDGQVLAIGSATGVWSLDETLNILDHHTPIEIINDLAWSPDGSAIAVTGTTKQQCQTQIWDAAFSHLQVDIPYCGLEIQWSSNSEYLAAYNDRETEMALIDVASKSHINLPGQVGVWLPGGERLVTSQYYSHFNLGKVEPGVFIWNAETGEKIYEIMPEELGTIPLWAIDSDHVAIRCNETTDDDYLHLNVCGLDLKTGEFITNFEIARTQVGNGYFATHIRFLEPDDLLVYVLDRQNRGFLNSIVTRDIKTEEYQHVGYGQDYDLHPDTNIITSIVGNGYVRNLDRQTGEFLAETYLFTAPINSIAWHPNNQQIASSGFGYDHYTEVWDVQPENYVPRIVLYSEPAGFVTYTPDGSQLVTRGTIGTDIIININDGTVWDASTGERQQALGGCYSQFDPCALVAWNADLTQSARCYENEMAQLSDGPTLDVDCNLIRGMFWSPDGSRIATLIGEGDNYTLVETWNASTGELINSMMSGMEFYEHVVWSPDNTKVAIVGVWGAMGGDNRYVTISEVKSGRNYGGSDRGIRYVDLLYYPETIPYSVPVVWSPDSLKIAASFSDGVHILSATNEQDLLTIPAVNITSLSWSADGSMLAGGSTDGTIYIWNVADLMQ
jgi:WD40 repeat protein